MKIQALTGSHDRILFDCGVDDLDIWLQQTALQHQSKGVSRTFVAVPQGINELENFHSTGYPDISETTVLGFFALASAFVLADDISTDLAKRYPRQLPVTRLGRLAIRTDLQGQGLGRLLLADAITRSRNAALSLGSAGIFVDAKNAAAANFYAKYGFQICKEQPLRLYLPMW